MLVSIIIPTHNRAALCREAAISALKATTGYNAEIIIMDDASTQDLKSVAPPGVRVERIARSGMPGHVRNEGVARARGEFIAFLDSDDLWHEGKLRRQLEVLGRAGHAGRPPDRHTPRMVHCRERWLRNGREVSQKGQRHRRRGDIFDDAVVKCIVGPSTFMVERALFTAFGGYRGDLEIAEDYELMLRMLAFEPIEYVDEPLVDKRDGLASQLSHTYGHIEGFRIRALGDVLADALEAADAARSAGSPGAALPAGELHAAVAAIDSVSRIHRGGGVENERGGAISEGGGGAAKASKAISERGGAISEGGGGAANASARGGSERKPSERENAPPPGEQAPAERENAPPGERAHAGRAPARNKSASPPGEQAPAWRENAPPGEGAPARRPPSRTRWNAYDPARISSGRIGRAASEYARKCRIFATGAEKRGREEEATVHRRASERVEGLLGHLEQAPSTR